MMEEKQEPWEQEFFCAEKESQDEQRPAQMADSSQMTAAMIALEKFLRQMESATYYFREQLLQMQRTELLQMGLREIDDVYRDKGLYFFEKELAGIEIQELDGCVRLLLPALLPHRRSKPESLFIKPLFVAAQEFMAGKSGGKFREKSKNGVLAVICHSYQADYMVRDNDNVEIKAVLDTLVFARLLPSDRGDFLSVLSMAVQGQAENRCQILLIPREHPMLQNGAKHLQELLRN